MRILLQVLLCIPVIASTYCHAAGIQIGRTRIIYDAAKKEVALPLQNNDKELPWLIQSWTDTGDGKTHGPFIVTPPLFRLDPQKEQSLRITWNGTTLAGDKESLFYMNVRTVPATATDEGDKNVLRLFYKTRLKLFWRPADLKEADALQAYEKITFLRQGNRLIAKNPTPFYVSFGELAVGGKSVPVTDTKTTPGAISMMVAPFSEQYFSVPQSANGPVTWTAISDFGAQTSQRKQAL